MSDVSEAPSNESAPATLELVASNPTTVIPVRSQRPQSLMPAELLSNALANNASVDIISRLMDLQDRWEQKEARKAFSAAIASAKALIKPIQKNHKVDFTTAKGRTNYDYEDLGDIASVVDPILAQFGLSYRYRARQSGGKIAVTCIVEHRDGYFEETTLEAGSDHSGNKNEFQAVGSAATYLQRYTIKLALGLAASKDDDARSVGCDDKSSGAQNRRAERRAPAQHTIAADPCTKIKWSDDGEPVMVIDKNLYNVVSAQANKAFANNDPQWVLDLRARNADALRLWCKTMGKEARDMLIDLFARAEAAVAEKETQQSAAA